MACLSAVARPVSVLRALPAADETVMFAMASSRAISLSPRSRFAAGTFICVMTKPTAGLEKRCGALDTHTQHALIRAPGVPVNQGETLGLRESE